MSTHTEQEPESIVGSRPARWQRWAFSNDGISLVARFFPDQKHTHQVFRISVEEPFLSLQLTNSFEGTSGGCPRFTNDDSCVVFTMRHGKGKGKFKLLSVDSVGGAAVPIVLFPDLDKTQQFRVDFKL